MTLTPLKTENYQNLDRYDITLRARRYTPAWMWGQWYCCRVCGVRRQGGSLEGAGLSGRTYNEIIWCIRLKACPDHVRQLQRVEQKVCDEGGFEGCSPYPGYPMCNVPGGV